jgi:DNA polymerase-3 subunit epsilon
MEIFAGATLVAHHAGFDLGQLRSAAHHNQLDLPDLPVYCSVAIAKRVWPLLPSYKLSYLAQMLDFTYQHHEAGEDARACAMVVLAAEREQGVSSLRELAAALSLHPRNLGVAPRSNVLPTDRGDGEQHPLLGKRICFTRTLDSMTRSEAEAQVEDVGGIKRDNVSKLVDYLVIGDGHYADFLNGDITGKMKTAIALLAEGNKIEIIPESEFLTLLYS